MKEREAPVEITEGGTRLIVPPDFSTSGPGTRKGRPFFNQQMAFSRDISVLLLDALHVSTVLDGMAGTGARGVRLANEASGDFQVTVNDLNRHSFEYIVENIELNHLNNCRPTNEDIRCLTARKFYDYVDLDPFGSPAPYTTSAIQGCKRGGVLAVTATDTALLAGAHAKKCRRRYGATPCRCSFCHEVGLRILVGFIAREAAKLDRGISPLLCYFADHYFRVYVRIKKGAKKADRSLAQLGFIYYDDQSGRREFRKGWSEEAVGPLWGGTLKDQGMLEDMEVSSDLAEGVRCEKYLSIWKEELDVPFHYDTDEIASLMKGSPPKLDEILARLNEHGRASRAHYSPTSFKTDIEFEDMMSYLADLF